MTVYIVITEWNRPHDCEGGFTLEGVALSRRACRPIVKRAIREYRSFGHVRFRGDDPEWDYDLQIEERDVEGATP